MPELYPTSVVVNQENIDRLTTTFRTAYEQIYAEILNATDFGVANRKAILAQIDKILEDLGVEAEDMIETDLPDYYKQGADLGVKQLQNANANVEVATGFNRVHVQAINALVDDASKAFGESLTGVSRSANLLLGRAVREQITQNIATGIIGGANLRAVRRTIKATLNEQGLSALIDKGGNTWTLDRYAEMLFRTKAVEARNRGLMNRLAQNGFDLVQVSNHNSTHQACAVWESKILSISGETPGFPTVAEAEAQGLFHPNCRHAINAISPSLAKLTQAYYPDERARRLDTEQMQKLADLGLV